MPAYYRNSLRGFHDDEPATVLGHLIAGGSEEGFAEHKHAQTDAWTEQISVLRACCSSWFGDSPESRDWAVLLEYPIPRRAKRIDAIVLANELIFVLEFKSGDRVLVSSDRIQVEDYCLDLRDFHSRSRDRTLIPILVQATSTSDDLRINPASHDHVFPVQLANGKTAANCIMQIYGMNNSPGASRIDPQSWDESAYDPTPTIVEAAQRLYAGQDIREISRSHGGVANLTKTADAVIRAVTQAKQDRKKVICFVTGVPGSGKTLAGLNVVHNPVLQTKEGGLGVFLSGNGPLVKVLREALARDHSIRSGKTLHASRRRVSTFVQNVHEFIKTYVDDQPGNAPPDHVVLFDEAQRAWNVEQERRKFKRNESEPHMMLRIMDRHEDWAVIVALIGGGQEIHDGEAGLPEWGRTLSDDYRRSDAVVDRVSDELSAAGVPVRTFKTEKAGHGIELAKQAVSPDRVVVVAVGGQRRSTRFGATACAS
jgi:Schlafen group 3, DNA/RNA helicase domain